MLRGGTWGLIGAAIQHLVEAAFRHSMTFMCQGSCCNGIVRVQEAAFIPQGRPPVLRAAFLPKGRPSTLRGGL